ncbi:hypothetical protein AGMMS49545_12550 [Betaproteobacteria bacterium]|nr:hypothetical protein AGMMS49545_12550 [Betaproteobacteria bacterium]GHU45868.1 hypothetical protein AGMMS50289_17940 [Betaproteobacteria bacterium]
MRRFLHLLADALFQFVLTAWVGMIWTIGYLVAPTLFYTLDDRVLAGEIAGHLFTVSGWTGLMLGGYLLIILLLQRGIKSLRALAFWLTALLLILTAVSLFGIQPFMQHLKDAAAPLDVMQSALRDRFISWHGISSALYLLQSLLALGLLLRIKLDRSFER